MINTKLRLNRKRSIFVNLLHYKDFINRSIDITLFLCLLILFSSCQSTSRFASASSKDQPEKIGINSSLSKSKRSNKNYDDSELNLIQSKIISTSFNYIGTPYCYGGNSEGDCFDCSGFVQTVFTTIGISLPRTSSEQYQTGKEISLGEAIAGDLIFFQDNRRINHVGIYLGNNEMIHASTSKGVIRQNLNDNYFQSHLAGLRRVF